MKPHTRSIVLSLVFALAAVAGCKSKLTGNEGNLVFSYVADDDIFDFNKPIAPGARLDVLVAEVGTQRAAELLSASSDDESVLRVTDFSGNRLTLEAVASGSAQINVTARTRSGDEVPDSINMLARVPDVIKLAHTCTDDRTGHYLTSQRVLIPFDMERTNGQAVIGYGYYPVSVEPADGLTRDPSVRAQTFLHMDTRNTPGSVTIRSDIDSSTLDATLVDDGAIDGAEVVLGLLQETDVGNIDDYYLLPTVGGQRICQANTPKSVESTSPSICRVEDRSPPPTTKNEDATEFGWIRVSGLAEGSCTFDVTYPRGGNGQGVTIPLSIPIAP